MEYRLIALSADVLSFLIEFFPPFTGYISGKAR